MKNKTLYPVYLALAVCVGIIVGMLFNFPGKGLALNSQSKREQKVRQIISFIDNEYVDSVNTDSLLDETVSSLLQQLDPHSTYIPRSEVLANQEAISGSFVGIGIEFKLFKDTLTVVRVIAEGPSARAGLQSGQRILRADTTSLTGPAVSNKKVIQTLKGKSGTPVQLEVYDPLQSRTLSLTVRRGEVPVNSVPSAFNLNDTVGYLKLTKFTQRSTQELRQALKRLKADGAKHLILDLRDNPGGLLTAAEEIADEFLDDDQLIVFTKNRKGVKTEVFASRKGLFQEGKVAVLINEASASASEIVAGALQDNDRGVIVGRRSFGKGLVQEEITLSDGSRMRLTTQRYYTPSGRSIQKDFDHYNQDFLKQHNFHGQLPIDTAQKQGQSFNTKGGRTVYGGGGIAPDITIEQDSASYNRLLYHLVMTVNLDQLAFTYVDVHRDSLQDLTVANFAENFTVNEKVLNYFTQGQSLKQLSPQYEEELPLVKNRIKSFIAYNLLGSDAYQRVYAQEDLYLSKALEAMQKPVLSP